MSLGVRKVSETHEGRKLNSDSVAVQYTYQCDGCGQTNQVIQPSSHDEMVDCIVIDKNCNNCGKSFQFSITNPEVLIKKVV